VIWDLHESDERDRGAIFAALKTHLVTYLLEHPGRAAFIVDEAVTVTEDDLGARTLGDLVRPRPAFRPRGPLAHPVRHGLVRQSHRAHRSKRGRIQVVRPDGSARAVRDRTVARALTRGMRPDRKSGQGEGLFVTTGRRVSVSLYGHTSPGEFNMTNTDVLAPIGEDDDRRNGHDAASFAHTG
jgi:hypothetical protein